MCTNLDVTTLVMAIHDSTCWFCGDGNQDEDEECDAGSADACESAPCANGGTCHSTQTSFQCQCTEAYTGPICDTPTDARDLCDVSENDCDLHATCRHLGPGQHTCECFLGYAGDGQLCAEQGVAHCLADCTLQRLCPSLAPLEGATIEYSNGLVFPTTATYTCDASGGPPSDGDAALVCQEDGTWTGTEPTSCCADPSPTGACLELFDSWVEASDVDWDGSHFTLYRLAPQPAYYFTNDGTGVARYADLCAAVGLQTVTTGYSNGAGGNGHDALRLPYNGYGSSSGRDWGSSDHANYINNYAGFTYFVVHDYDSNSNLDVTDDGQDEFVGQNGYQYAPLCGWQGIHPEGANQGFHDAASPALDPRVSEFASWDSSSNGQLTSPRGQNTGGLFTLYVMPDTVSWTDNYNDGGLRYSELCAEYGLRGVGCRCDNFECNSYPPCNQYDCLHMPDAWSCNIDSYIVSNTGFGQDLVYFESDASLESDGSGQPVCGRMN